MSAVSKPLDHFVEIESGQRPFRSRPPYLPVPEICLGLFAVALGYAAFQTGGVESSDWNISLLLIGFSAALYSLVTRALPPPSSIGRSLGWTAVLVLPYIVFQLLPLPLQLLRLLSPERAHLLENLAPLLPRPSFAPLSINSATTWVYLLTFVGYSVAFLFIRDITSRWSNGRLWRPAIPLVLIGSIQAVIGLLQAGNGGDVQGTYGSFDHFAGLLEMVLPFPVAYGLALLRPEDTLGSSRFTSALKSCVAFLAATLILLAVLYSTSRMGTVATLTGLLVMGTFAVATRTLQTWKKAVAIAFLAILVLVVVVSLSPGTLITRFGGLITDKESRLPIWGDTLRLIAAFPLFGCGLGNYGTAFLKYQTTDLHLTYDYAHNDALQLLSELGLVGFLIVAVLMVAIFSNAARAATRALDRNTRYLGLACVGSIGAIALHSLADFNMYIPANALVLAWVSGIATGLPISRGSGRRTLNAVLFGRFAVTISCVLVTYATASIIFKTVFESDAHAERLFCHFGICDTDTVLAAQTLAHGGISAALPKPELIEPIRRDSAAPLRWCDLGDAMLKSHNVQQARYCFTRALALAPHIPLS